MSAPLPVRLRPNLIGIGAAKAGTTFLAGVLARHPEIFMPPQKELNALYYDDLDCRLDEYMDHFRNAGEATIRCDFSVRYLSAPNAPAAAARLAPDAKILAVLRDPVDQVQSHYWHLRRQNFSQPYPVRPAPDLFDALDRFPGLLVESSLYAKHLDRWRAHFPEERFFLMDYAELARDLPAAIERLCALLGIPPMPRSLVAEVPTQDGRRGVAPRGGVLGRLYPAIYASVAHGPYQVLKRSFGVRRVEALKRRLRLRETAEAIFFKPGYPKLGEADRRRLAAIFADDVARLAASGFAPADGWTRP